MTIHQGQQQLLFQLYHIYDHHESAAIADLVMENITGWKKIDRIINKQVPLSSAQEETLKQYAKELSTHRPVQYVLHEAWFAGLKFYVDENVLIPRPETEELVAWILEDLSSILQEGLFTAADPSLSIGSPGPVIVDIGTGSGCIPVALKRKITGAQIYSCDISEKALLLAKKNAISNQADIHFLQMDFLNTEEAGSLPSCHLIVSNPPYIPEKEKKGLAPHVVEFEPHEALFVPDHDPLIFFERIADFAQEKLIARGFIYVETHEDLASHVKKLFLQKGFADVRIKNDIHGKSRMIKATRLL
jgi:release factor glutamine methyltransferase